MRPSLVSGGLAGLHLPDLPVCATQLLFTPQNSFGSQNPPPVTVHSLNQPPHPYGLYTPPEEEIITTTTAMVTPPVRTYFGGMSTMLFRDQSGTGHGRSGANGGEGNIIVQNTRLQQPACGPTAGTGDEPGDEDGLAFFVQIPASINNRKGSLAEFAARITSLFWFGSVDQLVLIENGSSQSVPRPTANAIASPPFQKWVTTMLATTQVSQNVILLALLFIYRLRVSHPQVIAKPGSEFRLITVSLMMGNKFLDDSTYTNKTWAEVAGLSVPEMHLMEVEFLSNVRYNLFVSAEEWEGWHKKLGLFAQYLDQPVHPDGHETVSRTSPYPGPPYGTPVSPITNRPVAPDRTGYSLPQTDYVTCPQEWDRDASHTIAPRQGQNPFPELETRYPNRKRVRDWDAENRPAKRLSVRDPVARLTLSGMLANSTERSYVLPNAAPSTFSLTNLPTLSVDDSRRQNDFPSASNKPYTNVPSQPTQSPVVSSRVTVDPETTACSQPTAISTTSIPLLDLGLHRDSTNLAPPDMHLGLSISSSRAPPTLHTSSVVYDRLSPYRPVVNVHTLLHPPPSTIYPPRSFSRDQMHYQPLSKVARETKSGVLPYYPLGPGSYYEAQLPYPGFQAY